MVRPELADRLTAPPAPTEQDAARVQWAVSPYRPVVARRSGSADLVGSHRPRPTARSAVIRHRRSKACTPARVGRDRYTMPCGRAPSSRTVDRNQSTMFTDSPSRTVRSGRSPNRTSRSQPEPNGPPPRSSASPAPTWFERRSHTRAPRVRFVGWRFTDRRQASTCCSRCRARWGGPLRPTSQDDAQGARNAATMRATLPIATSTDMHCGR
jgi:hypothetical protein